MYYQNPILNKGQRCDNQLVSSLMKESPKSGEKAEKGGLRWRLRVIFLYYASYADRNNYKLLKTQNYRRFLIDSEAVQDQSGFPPFDIAFRKLHPSAVTLTQFQQLLPLIAHQLYASKTRKQALEIFLRDHIETLYHEILTKSEFGVEVSLVETLTVQSRTLDILESLPLRKAFEKYIDLTSIHQKNPEQTFEQVHNFLTDFQMSPKLIYKALAYLIFFSLLRKKDDARKYSMDDLKRMLICVAELNWRKTEETEGSQEEKITRLLQYMELSEGFRKMVDRSLKQNAIMVSFFKRQPIRVETEGNSIHQRLGDSLECPRPTYLQDNSAYFSSKPQRREDIGTVRQILQLNEGQQSAKKLREIFAKLCSHGEVANTRTLKSIKIKKYFQSLSLMAPISQTWLDLKIADLCRSSPSGKIEFPNFLQLLGLASKKLNVPSEELFQYLMDNHEGKQKGVKEQTTHQDIAVTILWQVEKQLDRIFTHYSTGRRWLTFEQLTHLLYDFDVFPAFLSKVHLYQLFQQYAKASSEARKLMGEVSLDQESFFKLLASISSNVGEDLSAEERIIFMLQKMQDSAGHRSLMTGQGANLIGDLRLRYASVYHINALKRSREQQQNFDELIEDYDP